MSELPYLEIDVTPDSERFWQELAAGRITLPWCTACDTWIWHPRPFCVRCLVPADAERTLSGEGEIYSTSVVHRPAAGFEDAGPYVSCYVTLDGGPTVLANVIGEDRLATAIGDRVRLVAPVSPVVSGAFRFVRLR